MSICPEIDLLRKLESGDLSDAQADEVIPHFAGCDACERTLERFRGGSLDSRVLRAALRDEAAEADPGATTIGIGTATPDRSGRNWDIPDYDRIRMCGAGAFGTVWAVRDRVGMHHALKTIDLSRLKEANVRCRESTALEAYCRKVRRHPNLIQINHVGVRGSLLYYTMELADDDATRRPIRDVFPENYRPLTLDHVIRRGSTRPDTAVEVVLRLLRGLSRLHETGLAHRDIKPANIIFVNRQPKLADIGMITTDTQSPSQVGTPDYMPPDGKMDETADVYALGRVLYEMLVGRDREKFPVLPDDVRAASDRWDMDQIVEFIETACAPHAVDRYATAEHATDALERCRDVSLDSLFDRLEPIARSTPSRPQDTTLPVILALISAVPWFLAAIVAIVLINKYL